MLVAGLARGLQANDIEHMTLGMWIDYIIEWNTMNEESRKDIPTKDKGGKTKKTQAKKASQADFDAFFGRR